MIGRFDRPMDKEIEIALKENMKGNNWLAKCQLISNGLSLAISIDNYINSHKNDQNIAIIGKLAIAKAILEAERNNGNALYFIPDSYHHNNIDFWNLDNTWYLPFFQLITEDCQFENLDQRFSQISLVIFNYDRCVEHFLIHALAKYYNEPLEDAVEKVKCINIIHPYGTIGLLPLMATKSDDFSIPYGGHIAGGNSSPLTQMAKNIRTFTEEFESGKHSVIETAIADSARLVFLGFAYHDLNMDLLSISEESKSQKSRDCYGTCYEMSNNDQEITRDKIIRMFNPPEHNRCAKVHLSNCKCREFFNEYWKSLGFTTPKSSGT